MGDLTIICGENNTGKTYAACALYGFLHFWHTSMEFPISNDHIYKMFQEGVLKIKLAKTADKMLAEVCRKYTHQLDKIFAAPEGTFQNSEFAISTDNIDIRNQKFYCRLDNPQLPHLILSKHKQSEDVIVTVPERSQEIEVPYTSIKGAINFVISTGLFFPSLPKPFIVSAERTEVAIFRKELNFARNRLFKEIEQTDKNVDPRALLLKSYQSYSLSVENNVDFSRQLEDIGKRKSFIAKEHPEILEAFGDIIGGEYVITQNDQ